MLTNSSCSLWLRRGRLLFAASSVLALSGCFGVVSTTMTYSEGCPDKNITCGAGSCGLMEGEPTYKGCMDADDCLKCDDKIELAFPCMHSIDGRDSTCRSGYCELVPRIATDGSPNKWEMYGGGYCDIPYTVANGKRCYRNAMCASKACLPDSMKPNPSGVPAEDVAASVRALKEMKMMGDGAGPYEGTCADRPDWMPVHDCDNPAACQALTGTGRVNERDKENCTHDRSYCDPALQQ